MWAVPHFPAGRWVKIGLRVSPRGANGIKRKWLLLISLSALAGLPAVAHEPMGFDCAAPVRPADDQDDALWEAFLKDIDAFQACITAAADRHQAASDAHQRDAFAAVDAWNDFVRSSLNAPEDFPWPPEER